MNRGKLLAPILATMVWMLGTSYATAQPAGSTGNTQTGSPQETIRRGQPEKNASVLKQSQSTDRTSNAQPMIKKTTSKYEERVEKITVKSGDKKVGNNKKTETPPQQQPGSSQGQQPMPAGRVQNQTAQQPLEEVYRRP